MKSRVAVRAAFTVLLAGFPASAFAHISTRSPYAADAIDAEAAATASNLLFALLQLLGFACLAWMLRRSVDPKTRERRTVFAAGAIAFGVQLAVTAVLLACDFVLFLPLNFGSTVFHVNPAGLESFAFREGLFVLGANVVGFGLAILMSRAALVLVPVAGSKWGIALTHALVYHPFLCPVGPLIALMRLVYAARVPDARIPDAESAG